jgi:hypothetical protein
MTLLPYNYHAAHRDDQHRESHKVVSDTGGAPYITDRLKLQEQLRMRGN